MNVRRAIKPKMRISTIRSVLMKNYTPKLVSIDCPKMISFPNNNIALTYLLLA